MARPDAAGSVRNKVARPGWERSGDNWREVAWSGRRGADELETIRHVGICRGVTGQARTGWARRVSEAIGMTRQARRGRQWTGWDRSRLDGRGATRSDVAGETTTGVLRRGLIWKRRDWRDKERRGWAGDAWRGDERIVAARTGTERSGWAGKDRSDTC